MPYRCTSPMTIRFVLSQPFRPKHVCIHWVCSECTRPCIASLDNEIEMELRLIVIARPPQRRKAALPGRAFFEWKVIDG